MTVTYTSYSRDDFGACLANMSEEEILALRSQHVTQRQAEEERQAKLRMSDPVGTLRIYTGLEDEGFILRYNEDDQYPEYADPENPSAPQWKIFWDYRAEEMIDDHQIDQTKLSEPIAVLTKEQTKML